MKTTKMMMAAALAAVMTAGLSAQENLLKGGAFETAEDVTAWHPGHWVHIGPKDGDYQKLLPQVAPYCKRMLVQDAKNGKWSMQIVTDEAFHQVKDNNGKILTVSNFLNQTVNVTPGKYRFSVWIKGKLAAVPGYNGLALFVTCTKADKKTVSLVDDRYKPAGDWVLYQKTLTIPDEAVSAQIRFAFYGAGTVQLDDATLEKIQ